MAYGIQNIKQAMTRPARQDVTRLSRMGLEGDDTVGHLTSGEMIVPKELQSPGVLSLLAGKFRQQGKDPSQFIVGTPQAQAAANPYTGAQQFKYGSDTSEGGATGGPDRDREGGRGGISVRGTQAQRQQQGGYGGELERAGREESERGLMERISDYLSSGAGIGGLIGGGLGLMAGTPTIGAKLGSRLGGYVTDPFRDIGSWGSQAYGGAGPASAFDQADSGDWERSQWSDREGFGGPAEGGAGIGGITDTAQPGVTTMPMAGPTALPEDIDYLRYGELMPGEGGGEKLMYPWQLPGGQTSYGQYPLFGGIEGFGPAPLPDRSEGSWPARRKQRMEMLGRSAYEGM